MNRRLMSVRRTVATALAVALGTPGPATAQLFVNSPDFRSGPIEGNDPLVGLAIPGATQAEYRSHLLWNLRSGLNVAALQCQFSRYLGVVDNYNALLAHHSSELATAYTTLNGYFRRVHGATQGPRRFDDYSTITYNNFSTLQAQRGFCQTASNILKAALTRPKGGLYQFATVRMRELRNSLIPAGDRYVATAPVAIRALPLPNLADPCAGLRGRQLRRCTGGR
jgi:hypothetical protein